MQERQEMWAWKPLGLQGDPTSPSQRRSVLDVYRKDWWSWNSNALATWCKELTYLRRSWCRERLRAGGEGDNRGWDDWMASLTRWTWVWVNSGSWWWTGRPGMLRFMGRKESHTTERLNWTEGKEDDLLKIIENYIHYLLLPFKLSWNLTVKRGCGLARYLSWGWLTRFQAICSFQVPFVN